MIEKIIDFSIKNRFLVLMATLFLTFASFWALKNTPLDAIPDLSPPQVIVQVNWAGQSPEIIEDQGTYPLVSQFLAIANIETVRGFSTYENSLIYIIFKEGTDLYWARTRVLEQLASIQSSLPSSMKVALGPDASGVGWVYEYALTSKTKNLAEHLDLSLSAVEKRKKQLKLLFMVEDGQDETLINEARTKGFI